MAQDAKSVNKLDILSYVCHFKSHFSKALKMFQMGLLICHKCGEPQNAVGHRFLRVSRNI